MANIRKTLIFKGVKVDDSVLVVVKRTGWIYCTYQSFGHQRRCTSFGQVTVSKLVVSGVSTFSDVNIGTELQYKQVVG